LERRKRVQTGSQVRIVDICKYNGRLKSLIAFAFDEVEGSWAFSSEHMAILYCPLMRKMIPKHIRWRFLYIDVE
jgi:hypothetical protein